MHYSPLVAVHTVAIVATPLCVVAAAGGGTVVLRLLELLDVVDKYSFHVSQWSSTVTGLYDQIQSFSNVSRLYVCHYM